MSAIGFLSMFAKITLHYITSHDDGDLENYMAIAGLCGQVLTELHYIAKFFCNRPTLFMTPSRSAAAEPRCRRRLLSAAGENEGRGTGPVQPTTAQPRGRAPNPGRLAQSSHPKWRARIGP